MESHRPTKLLMINPSKIQQNKSITQQSPSSPTRKRKATFITERSGPYDKLLEKYTELNQYIDILDSKIQTKIERNQNDFILAYRNHLKKARQQMQQIRKKALNNADSSVSQLQKIQTLQKQLILFRQQSIKLFDKLNEKTAIIQQLKLRINQLQTEKIFMENNVKILMKRNKYLQGLNQQMQSPYANIPIQIAKNMPQHSIKDDKSRPFTTALGTRKNSIRTRNQSVNFNKTVINLDNKSLKSEILSILGPGEQQKLEKIMRAIQINQGQQSAGLSRVGFRASFTNKQKINNFYGKKQQLSNKTQLEISSQNFYSKNELENFFFSCIQNAKKQILRRKGDNKNLNFYTNTKMINFEQFKNSETIRILEMLIMHPHALKNIHKTIFGEATFENRYYQ